MLSVRGDLLYDHFDSRAGGLDQLLLLHLVVEVQVLVPVVLVNEVVSPLDPQAQVRLLRRIPLQDST